MICTNFPGNEENLLLNRSVIKFLIQIILLPMKSLFKLWKCSLRLINSEDLFSFDILAIKVKNLTFSFMRDHLKTMKQQFEFEQTKMRNGTNKMKAFGISFRSWSNSADVKRWFWAA